MTDICNLFKMTNCSPMTKPWRKICWPMLTMQRERNGFQSRRTTKHWKVLSSTIFGWQERFWYPLLGCLPDHRNIGSIPIEMLQVKNGQSLKIVTAIFTETTYEYNFKQNRDLPIPSVLKTISIYIVLMKNKILFQIYK